MPIYEYECQSCGKQLEVTQRMTDAPLKTCDGCGKDTLNKLMSRSAFQLKGGGWYSDLYSSTKKDSGSSASTSSSTSSTSTTTTAAPAAAPASSGGSSSGGSSTASA